VSFYPQVENMHLIDYKVRVIGTTDATAALVRVFVVSTDGDDIWTTVGVSHDIIDASLQALTDSIEYKLMKFKRWRSC
ncbi:MAG: alpha-isopropylmalate synthase regulatory domain-containing protein, partial [Oscillospiraceae bacterium]